MTWPPIISVLSDRKSDRGIDESPAYPPSVIRKGAVLYAALYYISDDDKAKVEVTEWIVRSIQKRRNSTSDQRYVNLAQKLDGITWGKRSRKNGDFGWLPSIPSWCLKQFREGGELPFGVYTTRLAALKFAKVSLQEEVQYCEAELKRLRQKRILRNSKRSWRRTRDF